MTADESVLLITKTGPWGDAAVQLGRILLGERVIVVRGAAGDPLPEQLGEADYQAILSFLSPWIIPAAELERVDLAINFHPGSHHYPGTGCYNFALYEGAEQYGAVCHYMAPAVDSGPIISEHLFRVRPGETVETLKYRTMVVMIEMFHDIISRVAEGTELQSSDVAWSRRAFTRAELNELHRVTPDMPAEEIKRRRAAVTYPGFPGVQLVAGDIVLSSEVPQRKPIA